MIRMARRACQHLRIGRQVRVEPTRETQRWSHWTPLGERRRSLIRYQPDILARGLDVIFCGLNPAASAAGSGHNFSHRNNRFWTVLQLAGFTDVRLRPQDE